MDNDERYFGRPEREQCHDIWFKDSFAFCHYHLYLGGQQQERQQAGKHDDNGDGGHSSNGIVDR